MMIRCLLLVIVLLYITVIVMRFVVYNNQQKDAIINTGRNSEMETQSNLEISNSSILSTQESSSKDELTSTLSFSDRSVPNIVDSFRKAKIDWHSIVPTHSSSWERFQSTQSDGNLRMKVSKEEQTTDFLTQYYESGMADSFGRNHGPLLGYSGCDVMSDACMIHDEEACSSDEMCVWSTSRAICEDFSGQGTFSQSQTCDKAKRMTERGGWSDVRHHSECKRWIHDSSIVLHLDDESQAMFYHWMASWSDILNFWRFKLGSSGHVHILVSGAKDTKFFEHFGLISNFCWRRHDKLLPDGICFCNSSSFRPRQSRKNTEYAVEYVVNRLGLESVYPPSTSYRVGIISRRSKRFILNEYKLLEETMKLGIDCVLLPLERMTLFERIRAIRSVHVLVGVIGSGGDNVVYMHPGTVYLQLLPYKNKHRALIPDRAREAGVKYMEWRLTDRTKAVFHWDLYTQANKEKLERMGKEKILEEGQFGATVRETMMFWIQQDIVVPVSQWKPLILECVNSSSVEGQMS